DGPRLRQVARHTLILDALSFEQPGILDGHADVPGKRLQQLDSMCRKGVHVGMLGIEDANQASARPNGDVYLRTRRGLADLVVRVLQDIGHVVGLADRRRMPDHSVFEWKSISLQVI